MGRDGASRPGKEPKYERHHGNGEDAELALSGNASQDGHGRRHGTQQNSKDADDDRHDWLDPPPEGRASLLPGLDRGAPARGHEVAADLLGRPKLGDGLRLGLLAWQAGQHQITHRCFEVGADGLNEGGPCNGAEWRDDAAGL